jgi:hypothetical protein
MDLPHPLPRFGYFSKKYVLSLGLWCLPLAASGDEVARVLLALKPSLGADVANTLKLVQDAGSVIRVESYTPPGGVQRVGISSEIVAGSNISRSEFEWRPPGQPRAHYQHLAGGELWVGFRMWVAEKSNDRSISFFQIGPIRDTNFVYVSTGLYQLQLTRGSSPSSSHVWRLREFEAPLYTNGPSRIINPASAGGVTPFRLNAVPSGAARETFFADGEDAWVFNVRLRADASGLVRVWRNGELVADSSADGRPDSARANAFAGDYTRVKWGPYTGTSAKKAFYSDIIIAEDGGDDGYRWVAPADETLQVTEGIPFEKTITGPVDTRIASVAGLPLGWEFDPARGQIRGLPTAAGAGARILFAHADGDGVVQRRTVWALPGDAEADTADLDGDGLPNLLEDALGGNRRSFTGLPLITVGLEATSRRAQITFRRTLAGITYVVEAASSLGAQVEWVPIAINPGSPGEVVTVPDSFEPSAAALATRFFRVRVSRP